MRYFAAPGTFVCVPFRTSPGTEQLCDGYGIWTNDELMLLERPGEVRKGTHTNVPGAAKYRMEGVTRVQNIERFFHEYGAGTWPQYYKPAHPHRTPVVKNGVRELTGWDFIE